MGRCMENAENRCKSYPRCYGCNAFRNPINADRIRAMSDDELALFIRAVIYAEDCPAIGCACSKCFIKELCFNGPKWRGKEIEWLQQPVEGE